MSKLKMIDGDEGTIIGKGFEADYFFMGNGVLELKIKTWPEGEKKLAKRTVKYCNKLIKKNKRTGIETVSLTVDAGSQLDVALVEAKGVSFKGSEYMLKFVSENADMSQFLETDDAKISLNNGDTYDTDSEMKDAVRVTDENKDTFEAYVMPFKDGVYVYDVKVVEAKQGQGLGTKYMQSLLKAFSDGPVYIQVGSDNPRALHLYRKLGFETAEEIRYYSVK